MEHRWFARFGEPPPIRTDPELILAILEDDERREALSLLKAQERREEPTPRYDEPEPRLTEDAPPAYA